MSFPSTLSVFNRPQATDRLNSPSHSALHNTVSSAVGQLEAVMGLADSNSVLGTIIGDLRSPGSGGGGHIQTANAGGTGQTTFTKGDILVASSTSVLSKLSVGPNGQSLVADSTQSSGIRWGTPGIFPTVRIYSSTLTTWFKPSTLSYVVVEVIGGGGNGASNSNQTFSGGGGGAGGYARKAIAAASLISAYSVMAGGAATISWFGSILQATPGTSGSTFSPGVGGIGSILSLGSSTGEIMTQGQGGGAGISGPANLLGGGGSGGNSFYGGGAAGGDNPGGASGGNYGGGGSGGGGSGGGNSGIKAGGPGVVIVSEY